MAALQISLYAGRYQSITIGLAVVLIYMGIAVVTNVILQVALIGLGCIAFSLFLFPRINQVNSVKKAFKGRYPACKIGFEEDRVEIETIGSKTIRYDEINRLLLTRKDYFIEAKDRTLVCIPKDTIEDRVQFQNDVSEATDLKWTGVRRGFI